MKKFLAVLFTLILSMSMMSCSLAEETVEAKGEGVIQQNRSDFGSFSC